jgi:hypothetical protein
MDITQQRVNRALQELNLIMARFYDIVQIWQSTTIPEVILPDLEGLQAGSNEVTTENQGDTLTVGQAPDIPAKGPLPLKDRATKEAFKKKCLEEDDEHSMYDILLDEQAGELWVKNREGSFVEVFLHRTRNVTSHRWNLMCLLMLNAGQRWDLPRLQSRIIEIEGIQKLGNPGAAALDPKEDRLLRLQNQWSTIMAALRRQSPELNHSIIADHGRIWIDYERSTCLIVARYSPFPSPAS